MKDNPTIIVYEGKAYTKENIDEFFLEMYELQGPYAINSGGGIYVSEGLSVFPDGKMEEW